MSEKEQVAVCLHEGEILKAEKILADSKDMDKDMVVIDILISIFHEEVDNGSINTVFDYSVDMDMLVKHFVRLKLMLRRIEFDLPCEYQNEVYEYCIKNKVSECLLSSIIFNNIYDRQKVCKKLLQMYEKYDDAGNKEIINYLRERLIHVEETGNE